MTRHPLLVLPLLLTALAGAAHAQATPTPAPNDRVTQVLQRDVNQETRIRDGLQAGQLNTREAAVLQREQAQIDRLQSRALSDGKLSPAEAARINAAQDRSSQDIARARHNGVSGDPLSASSQRMQASAQRDIQQQTRVRGGVAQGQLTNRETARLEAGQARSDAQQFRVGRDGHTGPVEATRIERTQNAQSAHIHQLRHNATARKG